MILHKLKTTIPVWPIVLALMLAACLPANQTPASLTTSPNPTLPTSAVSTLTQRAGALPSSETVTVQCFEELVPPTITEMQPAQGVPGGDIKVIGSGGYLRDECGGYNESARTFSLYLDNELVGELLCYVNRCEEEITLSSAITLGTHCLSTQKDKCEFEFQITEP